MVVRQRTVRLMIQCFKDRPKKDCGIGFCIPCCCWVGGFDPPPPTFGEMYVLGQRLPHTILHNSTVHTTSQSEMQLNGNIYTLITYKQMGLVKLSSGTWFHAMVKLHSGMQSQGVNHGGEPDKKKRDPFYTSTRRAYLPPSSPKFLLHKLCLLSSKGGFASNLDSIEKFETQILKRSGHHGLETMD